MTGKRKFVLKPHEQSYDDYLSRTLGRLLPRCLTAVQLTRPPDPIGDIAQMLIKAADDQEYIRARLLYYRCLRDAKHGWGRYLRELDYDSAHLSMKIDNPDDHKKVQSFQQRERSFNLEHNIGKDMYFEDLLEEKKALDWIVGSGKRMMNEFWLEQFCDKLRGENEQVTIEKKVYHAAKMDNKEKERLCEVNNLLKEAIQERSIEGKNRQFLSQESVQHMSSRMKDAHIAARLKQDNKTDVISVANSKKASSKSKLAPDQKSSTRKGSKSQESAKDPSIEPTPPPPPPEWPPWSGSDSSTASDCPSDLRMDRAQAKREVQRAVDRGDLAVTGRGVEVFTGRRIEALGGRPPSGTPLFPVVAMDTPSEWLRRKYSCHALLDQELYTDCDLMAELKVQDQDNSTPDADETDAIVTAANPSDTSRNTSFDLSFNNSSPGNSNVLPKIKQRVCKVGSPAKASSFYMPDINKNFSHPVKRRCIEESVSEQRSPHKTTGKFEMIKTDGNINAAILRAPMKYLQTFKHERQASNNSYRNFVKASSKDMFKHML